MLHTLCKKLTTNTITSDNNNLPIIKNQRLSFHQKVLFVNASK